MDQFHTHGVEIEQETQKHYRELYAISIASKSKQDSPVGCSGTHPQLNTCKGKQVNDSCHCRAAVTVNRGGPLGELPDFFLTRSSGFGTKGGIWMGPFVIIHYNICTTSVIFCIE